MGDPLTKTVDPFEYAEFYARYRIDAYELFKLLKQYGISKENITVGLIEEILREHFKGKAWDQFE